MSTSVESSTKWIASLIRKNASFQKILDDTQDFLGQVVTHALVSICSLRLLSLERNSLKFYVHVLKECFELLV